MAITEVNQIDAIGKENKNLRLVIIDFLNWEYEDMHLEMLQDKINNYLMFIEKKQYMEDYGDDFEKKIIDIRFKHGITANGVKFINAVSSQINKEDIFINIHLPEIQG